MSAKSLEIEQPDSEDEDMGKVDSPVQATPAPVKEKEEEKPKVKEIPAPKAGTDVAVVSPRDHQRAHKRSQIAPLLPD